VNISFQQEPYEKKNPGRFGCALHFNLIIHPLSAGGFA
jgi:hypothetical protein